LFGNPGPASIIGFVELSRAGRLVTNAALRPMAVY